MKGKKQLSKKRILVWLMVMAKVRIGFISFVKLTDSLYLRGYCYTFDYSSRSFV